jgi:antitoxin FitA
MAQALIRNLDEELVADYRLAAKANGRSLEAEYREALRRARPNVSAERRQSAEAIRDLLPKSIPGPSGSEIIRRYRDSNPGLEPDALRD